MKITNETKIGALTSIAIVLLILGFNFLKGKDLFSHSKKIYAVFKNVDGLELSNSVSIKGFEVGMYMRSGQRIKILTVSWLRSV